VCHGEPGAIPAARCAALGDTSCAARPAAEAAAARGGGRPPCRLRRDGAARAPHFGRQVVQLGQAVVQGQACLGVVHVRARAKGRPGSTAA
jgi:hypothetical protein